MAQTLGVRESVSLFESLEVWAFAAIVPFYTPNMGCLYVCITETGYSSIWRCPQQSTY